MAANMALKRAAKANRRKAIVAEKRKSELLSNSPLAQVLRAAQAPIRHCVVSRDLFRAGMGIVMLTRGSSFELAIGGFLVDMLGLGVKDAYFQRRAADRVEGMVAQMRAESPVTDVDPSYARKLLRDAAAWARSHGVAPHRDYALAERLFGDVSADACDATFQFGAIWREGGQVLPPDGGQILRGLIGN
jgi:hypothetical protein